MMTHLVYSTESPWPITCTSADIVKVLFLFTKQHFKLSNRGGRERYFCERKFGGDWYRRGGVTTDPRTAGRPATLAASTGSLGRPRSITAAAAPTRDRVVSTASTLASGYDNVAKSLYTVKKLIDFPVPSRDVTRECLVSDIPAGDGKTANLLLQCTVVDHTIR
jgi:hypothetical protein